MVTRLSHDLVDTRLDSLLPGRDSHCTLQKAIQLTYEFLQRDSPGFGVKHHALKGLEEPSRATLSGDHPLLNISGSDQPSPSGQTVVTYLGQDADSDVFTKEQASTYVDLMGSQIETLK